AVTMVPAMPVVGLDTVEPATRPSGLARNTRFVDRLMGVEAVRATAPLPVLTPLAPAPEAATARAGATTPARTIPAATPTAAQLAQAAAAERPVAAAGRAPSREILLMGQPRAAEVRPEAQRAPEAVVQVAARRPLPEATADAPALRLGGVALRAEQLGGA